MDPLSAATTFATIVSLLADFKSQREDNTSDAFNDFLTWLTKSQHEELKNLIQQNVTTTIGIKALLNENKKDLAEKLEQLDRKLAILMSKDSVFSSIVKGLHPKSGFSQQAIWLLQQFETSGASKAIELHLHGHLLLTLIDGSQGHLEYDEPRFIEDDLVSLIENDFLHLSHNSSGKRVFIYTRTASDFVNSSTK